MIITSLNGLENIYNFSYIKEPSIVTILGTEEEQTVEQPFDILIDSDKSKFYKINGIFFWKLVNSNPRLSRYIRDYYRDQVQFNIIRLRQQLSNDRKG